MAIRATATIALLALAPAAAFAQDDATATRSPVVSTQSSPALVFTLRGGVATQPEYFGSDEYDVGPDLGFSLNSLSFGGRSFGNPDPWAEARGFGIRGSFRYIGERDDDDYGELEGLDDIDAAYEVGLGAGYAGENYYVFADVRRGFGGHEAWVGEVGADAVFRPSERLRVTFGPRAFFGSDDYASTYFDVSAAEAAASSFNAYDADGGLISTGVELGMRYKLSENWGLSGAVTYDRFRGDAEDSPIVQQGSEDQWGARLGVTRTFSFGG
ncbi:MltA-interacting MipA [Roseivivax marinus]|jgi:outer membrane scaffolding protein for murein synthesis (MipA/OmpV family)|uniref:MltA-interacting MipA n=1 Tax=Roseivivax marinus TaxID=1379903 RepID=W4HL14_9RHOB|nr:MipA/OmpV family protein [Roseivivax marinus]ETW13422.1 MltA-interacting MipA [Roseivivax marinus]UMA65009.1 MipA/OmpV family protein [Roseivivax marinus]SEK61620.1 Outer membrane scaffolding protein for murein synthesis, MipA/OmpV family [Roseivivax marinus]